MWPNRLFLYLFKVTVPALWPNRLFLYLFKVQMGCNIVTTLLQGTERKDWDKVWKHMRVAEAAEAENTRGPTPRARDRLITYGQLLLRHKKEGVSGIYLMNMPGNWRVMILRHVLRQVLLLDPFGDT